MTRPTVLICMDYYLPGVKAGGPITTIRNLVAWLGGDYVFRIVTADRDLGDAEPFQGIETEVWTQSPAGRVYYMSPARAGVGRFVEILRETRPDSLYLNSYWSRRCTLFSLIARRRVAPDLPLILAPRGEFAASALALKPRRKQLYRAALQASGLTRSALWQASSDYEAADIRQVIGARVSIRIAPDLAAPLQPPLPHRPKTAGRLALALLSRISPMKNIEGAIAMLSNLRGQVELSIYGPEEDADYARLCRQAAEALPENASVRFAGVLPSEAVPAALASADAFLLPSRGENFGHVILEALGAGTPVVISDRTPWRGLEKQGVGWDLPLEWPERFTEVLQQLTDLDEATHARLRAAARRYAEAVEREDWRLQANRTLFERALSGSRRSSA